MLLIAIAPLQVRRCESKLGSVPGGGRASIVHGFASLGLDRVISIAEPANGASIRVMRKLGMTEAHRTTHPDLGIPLSVHEIIRPAVTEANLGAP